MMRICRWGSILIILVEICLGLSLMFFELFDVMDGLFDDVGD